VAAGLPLRHSEPKYNRESALCQNGMLSQPSTSE